MKAILKRYNATLLFTWFVAMIVVLLMTAFSAQASDEPKAKVSKTWSKQINVSSADRISLYNQFGEVKVNTWNRNEVKVEVVISAEASTEEKAKEIIDRISIEDGKESGGVYFKTQFAKEKDKNWNKGEKQSFHIDYVAHVPAKNPLNIKNEFGPIEIGDYNGEVSLESKFGSLTTGKLANVKKLHVEFGKATIGSIGNGKLEVKFSKLAVDNMDGDVDANFEFCDVAKLKIDNSFKDLKINNKFSQLYVDVNTNISANFRISTSFGDLKNKTNFNIKEEGTEDDSKRHGPKFDKKYSGKAGSGDAAMNIRSEYGQVTIGHNLNVNMDTKERKAEERTREREERIREKEERDRDRAREQDRAQREKDRATRKKTTSI